MHLRRDPHVPGLPDSLLNQTLDNDEEIRSLVKTRYKLQIQLDRIEGVSEQGYNKVTLNAALERRRRFLKRSTGADFRKKYSENPLSSLDIPLHVHPSGTIDLN
jgi:hypothetical protein